MLTHEQTFVIYRTAPSYPGDQIIMDFDIEGYSTKGAIINVFIYKLLKWCQ